MRRACRLCALTIALVLASCAESTNGGASIEGSPVRDEGQADLIYFTPSDLDWGTVDYQEDLKSDVYLINDSSEAWVIIDLDSGCSCSFAVPNADRVLPGEALLIQVVFTAFKRGDMEAALSITGSFEGSPKQIRSVELPVSANVSGNVVVDPPRLVVSDGEVEFPLQRRIRLHHIFGAGEEEIRVQSATARGAGVTVSPPSCTRTEELGEIRVSLSFIVTIENADSHRNDDAVIIELDRPRATSLEVPIVYPD